MSFWYFGHCGSGWRSGFILYLSVGLLEGIFFLSLLRLWLRDKNQNKTRISTSTPPIKTTREKSQAVQQPRTNPHPKIIELSNQTQQVKHINRAPQQTPKSTPAKD